MNLEIGRLLGLYANRLKPEALAAFPGVYYGSLRYLESGQAQLVEKPVKSQEANLPEGQGPKPLDI